jgi:hypothetical protein
MTQNKIAPTTTMIRMFINTKSNATSRWRHPAKGASKKIETTLRQSARSEKRSRTNGAVSQSAFHSFCAAGASGRYASMLI